MDNAAQEMSEMRMHNPSCTKHTQWESAERSTSEAGEKPANNVRGSLGKTVQRFSTYDADKVAELHEMKMKKIQATSGRDVGASGERPTVPGQSWSQEQHRKRTNLGLPRQRPLSHKEQKTTSSETCKTVAKNWSETRMVGSQTNTRTL